MLDEEKILHWNNQLALLSKQELTWLHGFIAGKLSADITNTTSLTNSTTTSKKITIAYGTETGNSKKVATDLATKAKQKGIQTKLVALDQYRLTDLTKEEYFFTVISTQGEGEPPEAAKKFYDHIHQNGFKVPNMKYGVLALGDTSYPLYCKTGEDVDIQLQKLGGNRIVPLQKCDVDYETDATKWFDAVINSLFTTDATNADTAVATVAKPVVTEKKPGKKIYEATVLSNINLTATGSTKKAYHIELGADDIDYLPGDSIAINPENQPQIVEEILAITQIDGNKTITWKNETATIKELLTTRINISYLLEKAVKQFAVIANNENIPSTRTDLIDLLRKYPLNATQFEEFLNSLSFIAPRIYNIASSPNAHGSEVHIIALQDTFTVNDVAKKGLCTSYFEGKKEGDTIPFFIQPNKRFRLPAADKDIIMIGPGTGIAPFRSFVAERDALGATGKNWLFFGEENFVTDFYYQTEWQNWFNTGVLTKMSVAFSLNHQKYATVTDKLLQHAAEFFAWINNGAYLYVCGEKDPMSKDVEQAIITIFSEVGKMEIDAAKKYFDQLKTEGRYMKDVY
ncbi:MAG: diflavin oxidoreductase [Chitinophagaceae bacterium]